MVSDEQWLKELESTPPYTPKVENYKKRKKLPIKKKKK